MACLRFTDLQSRPTEFLDFTSLTLEEFQLLLPPFEAAFQAHMAVWRFDGTPRTAAPLYRVQELSLAHARRPLVLPPHLSQDLRAPGRPWTPLRHAQSKANQWIHVLLPAPAHGPAHPRRCPHALPAALAQRLGVTVREAAAVVAPVALPLPDTPAPTAEGPVAAASAAPLLPTTARSGASSAPKTLLNRKTVIAARKKTTP